MTLNLYETIQRIVQQELRQIQTATLGIVQEQFSHADESDQHNYACTVQLRDSQIVLEQVPVATSRIGCASIPAVGDLVLVQFIAGNINAPVITGSFYNDEDRPPVNDDGQMIIHLPLSAEESSAVHLELTSGDTRELLVQLGSGLSIQLRDDDPVVEIHVDDEQALVQIDRDGQITLTSKGDIAINADGNIDLTAQGDVNVKGATVNLN